MLKKRPKTLDSQFLIRVIKNEVGTEEKEFFYTWLSESEKNKEEFGDLVLLWDMIGKSEFPPSPDVNLQWEKINDSVDSLRFSNNHSQITKRRIEQKIAKSESNNQRFYKRNNGWILQIAAVLVIAIGLVFLFRWNGSSNDPEQIQLTPQKINVEYLERKTQKGERKTFPLADGTIVYLNSESKLVYPKVFSNLAREVELVGEAYFSVIPENGRAFKVISGKTVTIVTGTEFNVKNRNNRVNIVVAKGTVKACLKDSTNGIDLKKGEMISFSENKGFSKSVSVDLKHYLAWRNNKFSFEHTSLKEAMAEIERYYNLEVVFENKSVVNKRLTGIFKTDSLNQIFSIISLTLDVQIDRQGRKVIIK